MLRVRLTVIAAILLCLAAASLADVPQLINYQGRLTDSGGEPIDGTVSIVFTIYDAATDGNSKWTETQSSIVVTDGLFNVLLGSTNPIPDTVFNDPNRYLGIAVGVDPELAPRAQIVSVGYANRVSTIDGATGGEVSGDLHIAGQAVIGPCIVDGPFNFVAGEDISVAGTHCAVSGGRTHVVVGDANTVGGGVYNEINDANFATIAGGYYCKAFGQYSAIGGGAFNSVGNGPFSAISGGYYNHINGEYSAILGGYADTITAKYSYLFGIDADLTQDSTFMVDMPHIRFGDLATGYEFPESDGTSGQVMTTDGVGQLGWDDIPGGSSSWTVIDSVLYTNSYVGIARGGADNALYGTLAYTHVNLGVTCTTSTDGENSAFATVGGGYLNKAAGTYTTVPGGQRNVVYGLHSAILGGFSNSISGTQGVIGGGQSNSILDFSHNVIAGGHSNAISSNYSCISGGKENTVAGYDFCAISGGLDNRTYGFYSAIGGGQSNNTTGNHAAIGGGFSNEADSWSTVGGGQNNVASSLNSAIGGGYENSATGSASVIAGGWQNTAGGDHSTVGGGVGNVASGVYSTIMGGRYCSATANYTAAMGRQAKAIHTGTYVWADSTWADFSSTADNQYLIRAGGGVGINNNNPTAPLDVDGEIRSRSGGFRFPDGTVQTSAVNTVPDAFPSGGIIMWSGTLASIPAGWALCNGSNGTPNLIDRFIYSVGTSENPGASGGTTSHNHTVNPAAVSTSANNTPMNVMNSPPIASVAAFGHSHTVDIPTTTSSTRTHLPPYYKLAFIMKL